MNITVTSLRRDLFQVLEKARSGEEVIVTHKGTRFRLQPEVPSSKLDRVTPLGVAAADLSDEGWKEKEQLQTDWEAKWDKRLGS